MLLVLWQDLERLKGKIAAAAAPAAGESRAEAGAGGDRTGLSVARHLGIGFEVAGVHRMHDIGKVCIGLDATGARGLVAAAGVRGGRCYGTGILDIDFAVARDCCCCYY